MKNANLTKYFTFMVLLVFVNPAQAHSGNFAVQGLCAAFLHPWQGMDHLLVMLTIGLWSRASGNQTVWHIPAFFMGSMLAGVVVHLLDFTLPSAESLIALSAVFCGILVWQNRQLSGLWSGCISGLIAISHGYVHAVDLNIDLSTNQLGSLLGFLLSTLILICMGIAAGALRQRIVKSIRTGLGGFCIVTGMYLLVG